MSLFKELLREVDNGRSGRNKGVGIKPLPTYNNILSGIQRKIYTLVGGNTGTGKTAFVDYIYVLTALREWLRDTDPNKPDFRILYFSMERSRSYKIAKFVCALLYLDYRILIDTKTILSQGDRGVLADDIYDKVLGYEQFFEDIKDRLIIYDGRKKPSEIKKIIRKFAEERGTFNKVNNVETYEPNEEELVEIILDHIGKTKKETGFTKKESLDELSGVLGESRDICAYAPIVIQQFNRELSDPNRLREKSFEPRLEDFKESGNTQEDADVVVTLFNPYRYSLMNYSGYDIGKFVDVKGTNRFRSTKVLKNSFGDDDISVGLNFIGEAGIFKELPKPSLIKQEDYKKAINPTN